MEVQCRGGPSLLQDANKYQEIPQEYAQIYKLIGEIIYQKVDFSERELVCPPELIPLFD